MRRTFDDDELHWYALDVVRQKEYVTGYILQRFGCVTFIPSETRFRKRSRYVKGKGKIEVAYPVMPGVVFCGFPGPPRWFHVMSMHLVNGVLSVDGEPRRIETANPAWIIYRGRQLDGHLVIERQRMLYRGAEVERSASLVHLQGRGVIRSTHSISAQASADRPVVIRAVGERARQLGAILSGKAELPQAA
jgi:hypothetical protein